MKDALNTDLMYCQDRFVKMVRKFMSVQMPDPWNQKQVAEYVGVDEGVISKLLNRQEMGGYRTALKGHYLLPFVVKGVVDIMGLGIRGDNEAERKLIEIGRLLQDQGLLEVLYEANSLGIDVKASLSPIIRAVKQAKEGSE